MGRTWGFMALGAFGVWGAGCGDDVQPGCDPDVPCAADTGNGEGSASAASGMSMSSTSAAATSSSADTSLDAGSDGGSSGSDGEATAADASSGSSSTGAGGNVVYSAQALIGALDRILVFREDLDEDRCSWIILVSPDIGVPYDVTTPKNWAVQSIEASDVGDACGSQSPGMFGSEAATAAEGTIELGAPGGGGVYPCDVTVDVTAMFAGALPNVPPSEVFDAVAIPVTGC